MQNMWRFHASQAKVPRCHGHVQARNASVKPGRQHPCCGLRIVGNVRLAERVVSSTDNSWLEQAGTQGSGSKPPIAEGIERCFHLRLNQSEARYADRLKRTS